MVGDVEGLVSGDVMPIRAGLGLFVLLFSFYA